MKTTISEPESWKRVVSIEIPHEDIQNSFFEKLTKYRHDLKLPGFRPGKVPAKLIEQRYGPSIRSEIIDDFIQKSYREACEEHKIFPVAAAKIQDLKAPEGEALTFSVETEVDPTITIKGYDKLKIKATPKKIKEGDVDTALKDLLDRLSEFKDVDRPAEKGDFVKIAYQSVLIDGELRSDIKNPEHPIEIGGENSLKDFEKGLIGHTVGETVTISIKFPKNYAEANIAGKKGEFSLEIKAVQVKIIPAINEDLLKKLGDFADEAALREKLKSSIESENVTNAKKEAYEKAIDAAIKENPFEVPPTRVEQLIDYMYQEAQKYQQGDSPVPAREDIAEQYRETAVRSIKRQRIIHEIAELEHIKATQEEVDAEIERMAGMYQHDFDTLKQALRKNGTTTRIRDEIRERKTLDFLIGEYTPETKE